MFRKRKQPTPSFRLPPPYNPITGEHAALKTQGVFPYVAMMQVAAADTHANYVICRGFDIRHNVFVDYAEGDDNKPGIPVAKPYGRRSVGLYAVGEIHPAILPMQTDNPSPSDVSWRVGQNPGVANVSQGHPASLSEAVVALKDDNSEYIDWMLLDSATATTKFKTWYYVAENVNPVGSGQQMNFYIHPSQGYKHPPSMTLPGWDDDGVNLLTCSVGGWYLFSAAVYGLIPISGFTADMVTVDAYWQVTTTGQIGAIYAMQTAYIDTPPSNTAYLTASRTAVAYIPVGTSLRADADIDVTLGGGFDYSDVWDIYAELTIGPLIST